MLGALRMTPTVEAVNVPFVAQFVDDDGRFVPNEMLAMGALGMLRGAGQAGTRALRSLRPASASSRRAPGTEGCCRR